MRKRERWRDVLRIKCAKRVGMMMIGLGNWVCKREALAAVVRQWQRLAGVEARAPIRDVWLLAC
jgi:hypothetical protein